MQVGHVVRRSSRASRSRSGGSLFRHEATGAGSVMVIARACEWLSWKLGGQRCVVQGFGNVGGIAAADFEEHGATVIAVSTSPAAFTTKAASTSACWGPTRRAQLARGLRRGRARDQRGAARSSRATSWCSRRARTRSPARTRGDPGTPDRRRRERADLARGRRDSRRARHRVSRTCSRTRAAYHEIVLRVGADDLGRLFWGRNEIRAKLSDQLGDAFDRVWTLAADRDSRCAARRSSPGSEKSPERSVPGVSYP